MPLHEDQEGMLAENCQQLGPHKLDARVLQAVSDKDKRARVTLSRASDRPA